MYTEQTPAGIRAQLDAILAAMQAAERERAAQIAALHPDFEASGTNLLHYLALRSLEIRALQEDLHRLGLSSFTNCESHALSQVRRVQQWFAPSADWAAPPCDVDAAARWCQQHSEALLGPMPQSGRPHIMVTFSTAFLDEPALMAKLLQQGMSVARINCAHDGPGEWAALIALLRQAEAQTGRTCKVYMDLAGPKIRIRSLHKRKGKPCDKLRIAEGDTLWLLPAGTAPQPAPGQRTAGTLCIEPGHILAHLQPGEPIFFDDGKFGGELLAREGEGFLAKITRISTKKPLLKPEKGVNLPLSRLDVPALTAEDEANLPFICAHADMLGFSFVSQAEDIELLRAALRRHVPAAALPAIVLKIERLSAVQQLPALLLNGMQDGRLGVMIARGDLAVEIGYERLSEIQDELLWICEAAHVPVIWATQVLDSMNKTGFATRSEITDAAASARAECVMLNKGPYILKSVGLLDDVLRRQKGHVNKKRYIMRPLGIAQTFIESGAAHT